MGVQNPRRYTAEFKRQAVELARELGSAPKAAQQLGVPESNIHNWREKLKAGAQFTDRNSGNSSNQSIAAESAEEELKRLRRENQDLKKANYILKQAAAFFSQDHLK
jgi:transposase